MSLGSMLMQTGVDFKVSETNNVTLKTLIIDTQSRQYDYHAQELLLQVQKLRTHCFYNEFGVVCDNNLDADPYDEVCIHVVLLNQYDEVVATSRLLDSSRASVMGRFYSENRFYLQDFLHSYPYPVLEVGHSCIHPVYCKTKVLQQLWYGIARVANRVNANALMGCCAIPIGAGDVNLWLDNLQRIPKFVLRPKHRLPLSLLSLPPAAVPTSLKLYLRMGASVAQQASFDPDFHCADVFVWLPFEQLNRKYQHFLH